MKKKHQQLKVDETRGQGTTIYIRKPAPRGPAVITRDVSLYSGIESYIINPLNNSDFKMEVCNSN